MKKMVLFSVLMAFAIPVAISAEEVNDSHIVQEGCGSKECPPPEPKAPPKEECNKCPPPKPKCEDKCKKRPPSKPNCPPPKPKCQPKEEPKKCAPSKPKCDN